MKINMKGKTAEVLLYEDIGGWFGITADMFAKEVKSLGDVSAINLRINSNGGNVFDGVAIYNYLKSHKARVEVDVDGVAASIASIIAMAGDEIRIADNGWLMIHNPWVMTAGEASDLRKTADTMDGIRETLLDTYMKRTNLDRDQVSQMMDNETWINGYDSVEFGFADSSKEGMKIAASVKPGLFKNTPEELLEADKPQHLHLRQIKARMAQSLRKRKL